MRAIGDLDLLIHFILYVSRVSYSYLYSFQDLGLGLEGYRRKGRMKLQTNMVIFENKGSSWLIELVIGLCVFPSRGVPLKGIRVYLVGKCIGLRIRKIG